ncbi:MULTISPECIES: AAA family ATPase [unclassified Vibrio]|uniref:AAA family ATPase n=1 Tax=unclassified Vibrio TaxID=2614977 RepID=UPI003075DD8E
MNLGAHLTLIAGQNGTQKTTLLGLLSQTFSIPVGHPFRKEKPLSGDSYRSLFAEKFRLSSAKDKAGLHEWTLFFHNKDLHQDIDDAGKFTVESIPRNPIGGIRFWQKGTRKKGSGYVQLPVIYLSLKRVIPLGESDAQKEGKITLTDHEKDWFEDNYNRILLADDELKSVDYLSGSMKTTLGVSTAHYDWESNSAGQDNVGKILLAIISFMRLKVEYPNDYRGGILAIDEIDATLYPGSQVKLLELISGFCKATNIQIIATTHSLPMIEKLYDLKSKRGRHDQFSCAYLKKKDSKIEVEESPDYSSVLYNLKASMRSTKKSQATVTVFTEDEECTHFVKAILKRKFTGLNFPDVALGCGNLIQLGEKRVPSFSYPNSIVVLDGDVRGNAKLRKLKNYICLPGKLSPEGLLADFLKELSDYSPFWSEKNPDYNKQVCFSTYRYTDIKNGRNGKKPREVAKEWYKEQVGSGAWGPQGRSAYNYLLEILKDEAELFIEQFGLLYENMK